LARYAITKTEGKREHWERGRRRKVLGSYVFLLLLFSSLIRGRREAGYGRGQAVRQAVFRGGAGSPSAVSGTDSPALGREKSPRGEWLAALL
jgi:hypothetical protein